MLRTASVAGLRLAARVAPGECSYMARRGMALEGARGFSEAEKGIEDIYFTKEDQRIMAKLLAKVKSQSDSADKHAAEGIKAAEMSALKQIINKYNLAPEDVEKLLKWKHIHY